jgi:hypothetical protein
MRLLHELWHDESGSVISAELVLLGTLGVVGAGVGAAAVGDSVEAELEELAFSIRSLDQSYSHQGFKGCGAWTAGSRFIQRPVEESHAELRRRIERERAAAEEQARDGEQARDNDDQRPRDEDPRRDGRRRMRERESQQRERGERDPRWDGDERREREEARGDDAL